MARHRLARHRPADSDAAAGFGHQLVGVVLPDVVSPGLARRVHRARREALGHRHDAHTGRVPAGVLYPAPQRRRRAPPPHQRAGPAPGPVGQSRARSAALEGRRHTNTRLAGLVTPARCEKYPGVHMVHASTSPLPSTRRSVRAGHAPRPGRSSAGRPHGGPGPDLGPARRPQRVEVGAAELVAARADARPEPGHHRRWRPGRAWCRRPADHPAPRPRQPTCTAPWTPSGEPRATGAQSAVRHGQARTRPHGHHGVALGAAPSLGPAPRAAAPSGTGASTTTTPAPWTWRSRRTTRPSGTGAGAGPSPIDRWSPSPAPVHRAWTGGARQRRVARASGGTRGRRTRRHRGRGRPRRAWRRCPRARLSRPEHLAAILGTGARPTRALLPALEARPR